MSGLLKDEGVQQMEVRTLGGEPGRGQDVTIVLIPEGGSITDRKLALIHMHSQVLRSHSNYFTTRLSQRWKKPVCPSPPLEFPLEVQTEVDHYFDCFSNMYSPLVKSFGSVKQGVELLKVASQIDFQGLMERISLYLSCMFWTKEDEIRIREYAASPDFPRIHVKDLVARLGLDESDNDRQKQLHALLKGVLEASSIPSVLSLPAFLEAIRSTPPSEYSRKVVAILSQAAKEVFLNTEEDCNPRYNYYHNPAIVEKIRAVSWIVEALLKGQVAEELVQGIVHLHKIPKTFSPSAERDSSIREFAALLLVIYREVVAGRLLLKPPERMALLANWHVLLKSSLKAGSYEQAAADLFLTLPMKQQAELLQLQKERVLDFISASSLASVLHFH